MLESGKNEALKIETARRRTQQIRQYPGMGPVEIVAYMAAHAVNSYQSLSNWWLPVNSAVLSYLAPDRSGQ